MQMSAAIEGRHSNTSASIGMSVHSAALLAISVLAALSAAVLLERRLSGALVQPLPLGLLVCVAVIAAAVTFATTSLLDRFSSGAFCTAARWLVAVSLPLFAVALCLPQSPMIGLIVLWLAVVGAEVQLWRHGGRESSRLALRLPAMKLRGETVVDGRVVGGDAGVIAPESATQKLAFRRADDGAVTVEGLLRVDFAAGERTVNAHVAFCPAFLAPPQVDVELTSGPDCAVRQALVLPWGVRFELKLAEPGAAASVVMFEFLAREREPSAAHSATETVS